MTRKISYLFILLPVFVLAQNKMLTVEDAVMKQRTSLAPERMMQVSFMPGTHNFGWVGKKAGKECLIIQNADDMKRDTILGIDEFRSIMDATGIDIEKPDRFPQISWINATEFRFQHLSVFFSYNISTKRMSIQNRIPKEAENAEMDTISKRVFFTMADNVMVYKPETFEMIRSTVPKVSTDGSSIKDFLITNDGIYGLSNGKAVHRNEFGIMKGIFLSPKVNRIAYYKMYEGMVTDYPILNFNTRPATPKMIKYPMSGDPSHVVRVNIYDMNKKITYPIITGSPDDQYLTNVVFSPNEEDLLIAIVNRDYTEMKLNKYDATTGALIKTLFVETSAKYVEPEHPAVFVRNNPKWFIWQSKRDGHNHLYLYESNGKLVKQLTKGDFDVTEFMNFNDKGTIAYYMATGNDGLERHCFGVELESGKILSITKNSGVHQVVMTDDGKYFIDSYSNNGTPRKSILMNNEGLEKAVLLQSQNPLNDYKSCSIRIGNLTASDNVTRLNYRIIYPPQFDSTKKHPVLVSVYGGPHLQMVTNSWLAGADMWLYYMAQQGFIVFTIDNRGSANRGNEFEQVIYRRLGQVELEDQLTGLNWLKKQKYVDGSRVGAYGWSFGGFMVLNMMTRSEGFKAGVAGGAVVDWSMYEVMYTERYMDKPLENPDGYHDADMTNYVKNLKGKLILIHGTDDDTVLWQHSLKYIRKAIDENVQVDYFVYPGHKHNVTGKDRVHLMQKVTDYLKGNL